MKQSKSKSKPARKPSWPKEKGINTRIVESLRASADLFEQRNAIYGDNFVHFGKTMKGIFPKGLTLETEEEFNRFCIFVQVVSKATRYGQTFKKGGHRDSLDDTSVYAMMLAEYDAEIKEKAHA